MRKPNDSADVLWSGLCESFFALPALSVSEWSTKHRRLSRESSSRPGRWTSFPYQIEPMDAPLEPDVAETVYMWAAQLGKSELLNNQSGFFMHADPAPQLMVQPTIELAEAYSKERIAPMIRDTNPLRKLVKDPRSRDSGNTLLSKVYPGGNIAMVGANAPSGLAGRPRRAVFQDEIDRYPDSAGSEGDPCALADKRTESFPNCVKVKTSTPTIKGQSKIEKKMEASDFRKWNVKCPKCQHEHVLMWSQVKWPEGKPEEAYLECPNEECKAVLSDIDRVGMVMGGRWVATKPFSGIRGYWLNGMNTLFEAQRGYRNRLHQWAAEHLEAKDGGPEKIKTRTNTFFAETYEEAGEQIDSTMLQGHVEPYNPLEMLPRGVLVVTVGADLQGDRLEIGIDGWGYDEECWSLGYKVIYGDPRKDDLWKEFDVFLGTEFQHPCGMKLKIERAFVDMGYAMDRVLSFTGPRAFRGVFACKGINRVGTQVPPLVPSRPSRNNRARVPFWPIGVTVAKHAIYSRLVMLPGGPRTIHFPLAQRPDGSDNDFGFNAEYFKQLTAEKMRTRYSFGQPYYVFEKDNNSVRNEAIDVRVYSFAALHCLGRILWHKLKEQQDEYERNHPQEKEEAKDDNASHGPKYGENGGDALSSGLERIERTGRHHENENVPVKPKQPTRPFVPRRPRQGGWTKGW